MNVGWARPVPTGFVGCVQPRAMHLKHAFVSLLASSRSSSLGPYTASYLLARS